MTAAAFYEIPSGPGDSLDVSTVLTGCIESGTGAVLFDRTALPPSFFDLSTGFAGELVQQLGQYGIRMAAVVSDPSRCSRSFQDFVREANRGRQFRFFPTREEAIEWLAGAGGGGA